MRTTWVTGLVLLLCGLGVQDGRAQVGAMVRGEVLDEAGQPLEGVTVELNYTGKEPKTFVRTTNEKGGFVQVGLPQGPYTINFTKDGYGPMAIRTNLSWGSVQEIPTVKMKPTPKVVAVSEDVEVEADKFEQIKETFQLAKEAARAGRLDESEELYKQVLEKAPDLAEAHFNLGVVYEQKKDWPAAEAELKQVLELQPDKSDTYSALAAVYNETGRSEEALAILSDAQTRFAGDPMFQYNLAVTSLNAGHSALATAAFTKALELDPSKLEAHYWLGTLAIGDSRVEDAVAHLETYVSGTGQNPQNLATAQKLLETLKAPAKQ
jgi:tetratricopeptide (TPR) repeat protein